MPTRPCPICKKEVAPRASNPGFPFCSPRCRTLDLGRWLGEDYRVPVRHQDEQEDEQPPGSQGGRPWGDA